MWVSVDRKWCVVIDLGIIRLPGRHLVLCETRERRPKILKRNLAASKGNRETYLPPYLSVADLGNSGWHG
jgi:hypothetical protein